MPVELAPDERDVLTLDGRCVCGHGVSWHDGKGDAPLLACDYGGCGCTRHRRLIESDGQRDGAWSLGAEGGGSLITDHPHTADPAWDRCDTCGLGEAAHAESVAA